MFETQLAQIAATIPTYNFEKIPGHPEISFEKYQCSNHEGW
jgi:hypothetical protein